MHSFDDNVGAIDAVARVALALAGFASGFTAMATHPDWGLFLGLMVILPSGYLLLTAAARADPMYVYFGWDTVRAHRAGRGAASPARH